MCREANPWGPCGESAAAKPQPKPQPKPQQPSSSTQKMTCCKVGVPELVACGHGGPGCGWKCGDQYMNCLSEPTPGDHVAGHTAKGMHQLMHRAALAHGFQ